MEEYIPDRNITADHIPITMNNAEELKKIVKEKYSNIALASEYDAIRSAGFQKIQVLKKRRLDLPGALLDPDSGDISKDRKESLQALSHAITDNISRQGKADIIFICTHNSRRSQFCQAWARAASLYYGLDNISAHSGGTESTALNSSVVAALERAGFSNSIIDHKNENPVYLLRTGESDEGDSNHPQ